jgi:hypothetical protein
VIDGVLTIENGTSDEGGFATRIFADPLLDTAFSPAPGDLQLTDFPGFEINGLEVDEGLYLQAMARPVRGSDPVEQRLLWYWNPATQEVEVTVQESSLRVISTGGFGEFTLPQAGTSLTPALKIAQPLEGDLGEHRHLLYYALDDSPPAAAGAYGFFAQLTSPFYGASSPFFIALNNGISSDELLAGALAINAAAAGPAGLIGDYNGNGTVEQADLDLVLLHWGSDASPPPADWVFDSPDGQIDQDELDRVLLGWGDTRGIANAGSPVPESPAGTLFAIGLVLVLSRPGGARMLTALLTSQA